MTLRPIRILATGVAVVLLMVLFPPYFGVYDQTGVNRHTGLGYHPIWNPPSRAEAYATIHGVSPDAAQSESGGNVTRSVEERLALTRVGFNKAGYGHNGCFSRRWATEASNGRVESESRPNT